jgi:hypothetical protein
LSAFLSSPHLDLSDLSSSQLFLSVFSFSQLISALFISSQSFSASWSSLPRFCFFWHDQKAGDEMGRRLCSDVISHHGDIDVSGCQLLGWCLNLVVRSESFLWRPSVKIWLKHLAQWMPVHVAVLCKCAMQLSKSTWGWHFRLPTYLLQAHHGFIRFGLWGHQDWKVSSSGERWRRRHANNPRHGWD